MDVLTLLAKNDELVEQARRLVKHPIACEECGGKGIDVGSLYEPEECPACMGSGIEIEPEIFPQPQPEIEDAISPRRPVVREIRLPNVPDFAEQAFRRNG